MDLTILERGKVGTRKGSTTAH